MSKESLDAFTERMIGTPLLYWQKEYMKLLEEKIRRETMTQRVSLWDKLRLLFVKAEEVTDVDGDLITTMVYKRLGNRAFVIHTYFDVL